MTEAMAVRTVRQTDNRPLYHFPCRTDEGKSYRKPVANAIEDMLLKQVADNPRAHLIVAIIAQAARDALNPPRVTSPGHYSDAFRFFTDGRMDQIAEIVDLEGDYVRRLIVEAVGGEVW